MSFADQQQQSLDGSRQNAVKVSGEFKRKRIKLDQAASKNDFQGENIFPYAFKSFWIVETNSKDFIASMIVNPKGDGGDSLPLKLNMSIAFDYRQNGCAFEFPAQAGVWIDVVFAFDSNIQPGSLSLDSSGSTVLSEGSNFTDGNPTITNTGASVLLTANSSRKLGIIQNSSGQPIWVGTQTSLASIGYKKKCLCIDAGDIFEWRNAAQLFARVETTTTDEIAVMELT